MQNLVGASRRAIPAAIVVAIVASSVGVVALASASHDAKPAAPVGANAGRFLQLTGDGSAPTAAASGHSANASAGAAGSLPVVGGADAKCPEGAMSIPQGWCLTPAGDQTTVLRFPLGLVPTAHELQIVVTADSGAPQGIAVIDANNPQAVAPTALGANLFMGVAVTPAGKVYASGGNADRVFRFQLAGPTVVPTDATEAEPFPLHAGLNALADRAPAGSPHNFPVSDGIYTGGYPGNSVLDGDLLYVAGTLSESGGTPSVCQGLIDNKAPAACSRVKVIDTTTDSVVATIPVGLDAYGLALDKVPPGTPHKYLYVSNWADEAGRGGTGGGTISIIDLTARKEVGVVHVGHHPSAVQLSGDGRKLFVADTNDDQIAIVDLTTNGVSYQSVAPFDGAQVGAHPDAFALSPDGTRLFVALAGLNAVEVRDGTTGARLNPAKPTYIPTGWYPSALTVTGSADHYRLWVANAKGGGSAPGYNTSVFLDGSNTNGTVSSIPLLANSNLAAWTTKVFENDALGVTVNPCPVGSSSEVLCPPKGRRSPIKHVVYIVTENKTFDQYFGDINQTTAHPGYDADPSYILYGQPVTPNHHKLADLFSLGDNFFSDAEVSVTGHSWTSGAIATDHNEKTWQADYDQGIRGTHGGGDPLRPSVGKAADGLIGLADAELQDPEGGYIFEDFKNHGAVSPDKARPGKLSMGIYGEHTARASDGMAPYKAPGWKDGDIQYFDTCRAWEFIKGQAPDGPVPNGSSTADDSNDQYQDCEGRALPPQFNLAYWLTESKAGRGDKMPSFIYMSLPVNHTLGTNVGNPTPASMVADNDYAIGLIVDALSHSPFWGSTVVMQTEDDTQAAGDHVSPLRDYLELSSPWASKGPEHQRGSMPALLRTIEQIFGLPPVTLNDRLAAPMHAAFMATTASPDLTPYTAVTPLVPFAVNQPGAVGQAESASMNFSTVDLINEDLLNAILYADARHTTLQIPPKFKR